MTLVIGERHRSFFEKSLIYQYFELLWMPDNPSLDPRLAGHTDLNILRCEEHLIVARGMNDKIVKYLTNRGYVVWRTAKEEQAYYPEDAGLCVCDTGRFLLANPKTADKEALDLFADRTRVPVKQGYTACCVCVADAGSIITSDQGSAAAAETAGLEVLRIAGGAIELPGFSEGFIGGACVRLNKNTIGFFGELASHPDGRGIRDFLARKGQRVLELRKGPLLDMKRFNTPPNSA